MRALAAPASERTDQLLAWCLRVADELGLPESERTMLGRAAQLRDAADPAHARLPELRTAAGVATRALERWDATREVPLASQVLAACEAVVSGEEVDEDRFAPEVVDAVAAISA